MDNFDLKKYLAEGRIHLSGDVYYFVDVNTEEDEVEVTYNGESYKSALGDELLFIHYFGDGEYHSENDAPEIFKYLKGKGGELEVDDEEATLTIKMSNLEDGEVNTIKENIEQYIDSEDDISDIRGGKTIAINFSRRMNGGQRKEAVEAYVYNKYGNDVELDWRDGQEVEIHIGNASNGPSPSNNLGVSDLNKYVEWKKKNFPSIHSPVHSPLREGKELDVVETDNRDSTYTILRLSNGDYVEVNVIELYQNLMDNQA